MTLEYNPNLQEPPAIVTPAIGLPNPSIVSPPSCKSYGKTVSLPFLRGGYLMDRSAEAISKVVAAHSSFGCKVYLIHDRRNIPADCKFSIEGSRIPSEAEIDVRAYGEGRMAVVDGLIRFIERELPLWH